MVQGWTGLVLIELSRSHCNHYFNKDKLFQPVRQNSPPSVHCVGRYSVYIPYVRASRCQYVFLNGDLFAIDDQNGVLKALFLPERPKSTE